MDSHYLIIAQYMSYITLGYHSRKPLYLQGVPENPKFDEKKLS